MGVDCYGWVEVNDPTTRAPMDPGFPGWWSAVIRIDDIVDRADDAYGFFFSVYKHPDHPIASRRGLPAHVSEQVQTDTNNLGYSLTAATWILWSEVVVSNWQASITLSAGWCLLLALMERLAAEYGDERVRLVIWFDADRRV